MIIYLISQWLLKKNIYFLFLTLHEPVPKIASIFARGPEWCLWWILLSDHTKSFRVVFPSSSCAGKATNFWRSIGATDVRDLFSRPAIPEHRTLRNDTISRTIQILAKLCLLSGSTLSYQWTDSVRHWTAMFHYLRLVEISQCSKRDQTLGITSENESQPPTTERSEHSWVQADLFYEFLWIRAQLGAFVGQPQSHLRSWADWPSPLSSERSLSDMSHFGRQKCPFAIKRENFTFGFQRTSKPSLFTLHYNPIWCD